MTSGLRGVASRKRCMWLFLVDEIITVFAAVAIWCDSRSEVRVHAQLTLHIPRFCLPYNVVHIKGGLRGVKPWFSNREVQIAITRVIQDDPAKQQYE